MALFSVGGLSGRHEMPPLQMQKAKTLRAAFDAAAITTRSFALLRMTTLVLLCRITTRLRRGGIPGQRPGQASWRYFVLVAFPGGMRCRPYNFSTSLDLMC